jgi:hypothetical protein
MQLGAEEKAIVHSRGLFEGPPCCIADTATIQAERVGVLLVVTEGSYAPSCSNPMQLSPGPLFHPGLVLEISCLVLSLRWIHPES